MNGVNLIFCVCKYPKVCIFIPHIIYLLWCDLGRLLEKLLKQYPFLGHIQYAQKEYIGYYPKPECHCTSFMTGKMDGLMGQEAILQLTTGWVESNEIPINIS